jgi:hypothetical protein
MLGRILFVAAAAAAAVTARVVDDVGIRLDGVAGSGEQAGPKESARFDRIIKPEAREPIRRSQGVTLSPRAPPPSYSDEVRDQRAQWTRATVEAAKEGSWDEVVDIYRKLLSDPTSGSQEYIFRLNMAQALAQLREIGTSKGELAECINLARQAHDIIVLPRCR